MAWNMYPYTDNHELNLDWFLTQFKNLLSAWDDLQAAWTAYKEDLTGQWESVEEAWLTYKKYIDEYFENLDVQDEINNKIDSMAASGELLDVISPTVIIQATLAANKWLGEHLKQNTGYTIDTSLSVTNAAADAKVTGDYIRDILANLDTLNTGGLNLKDDLISTEIQEWLDNHPEATTSVLDGSITESKLASSLLSDRFKWTYINNKTTFPSGMFKVYYGCTILPSADEDFTILSGTHVFINCSLTNLFLQNSNDATKEPGKFIFINCNFQYIRIWRSQAEFYNCTGNSIGLISNCDNSIIKYCTLTADTHAPIVISGSIAHNCIIANNYLINRKSATLTGIDLQCLNTHGLYNSIIINNYCECDTERESIDMNGNEGSLTGQLRSSDNLVAYNYCKNGHINLYAVKNTKCINNICKRIKIGGIYTETANDYGYVLCTGNICSLFEFRITSGNPTQEFYLVKNVCTERGITAYYDTPSTVTVHFLGNTVKGLLATENEYSKFIDRPSEYVMIPLNGSVYIPRSYIVRTDAAGLTADSYWIGGLVSNTDASFRYVEYIINNKIQGESKYWDQ